MTDKNKNKKESRLSDEEIIELYWQRQEKAISETDKKYGKYLFTIAFNILRDDLDCEECVNDTYLGAWNAIPPTRPTVFQVFLSRITRNVALDKYRRSSAAKRIPSEMIKSLDEFDECMVYSMSAEEEYLIGEIGRILNDYLHTLSARDEYIFVCRYYYSDTISDIAKAVDVSSDTVSRALAKMRNEIKDLLVKEGYGNE